MFDARRANHFCDSYQAKMISFLLYNTIPLFVGYKAKFPFLGCLWEKVAGVENSYPFLSKYVLDKEIIRKRNNALLSSLLLKTS